MKETGNTQRGQTLSRIRLRSFRLGFNLPTSRPRFFYKYRSVRTAEQLEWLRDIIVGSRIYFGSPEQFNDPLDCVPYIDPTGTDAERLALATRAVEAHFPNLTSDDREAQIASILEGLSRDAEARTEAAWQMTRATLGVVSLSCRRDDFQMWSHYADSHQGVALEFRSSAPPFSSAYPVKYGNERPVMRSFAVKHGAELFDQLLHKASGWRSEQEWRAFRPKEVGPHAFPPEALRSIIFGPFITAEREAIIRDMIAARGLSLKIKRSRLHYKDYRLVISDDGAHISEAFAVPLPPSISSCRLD